MATENVVACETCGLVQRLEPLARGAAAECFRCGTFLGVRKSAASLHITAALSLAALVLYVPANIYPILRMTMYGRTSESTIWDGVVKWLDLKVRENNLDVGSLSLQWGSPEIRIDGNWVNLSWPEQHITGLGWSSNGRFTYFQALSHITFAI